MCAAYGWSVTKHTLVIIHYSAKFKYPTYLPFCTVLQFTMQFLCAMYVTKIPGPWQPRETGSPLYGPEWHLLLALEAVVTYRSTKYLTYECFISTQPPHWDNLHTADTHDTAEPSPHVADTLNTEHTIGSVSLTTADGRLYRQLGVTVTELTRPTSGGMGGGGG